MFWWFDDNVHYKLQLAHKIALLKKIDDALTDSNLDNILKTNKTKRNELFAILNFTASIANSKKSVLADSTKNSIYSANENWIKSYPSYYKRSNNVDCNLHPYRALLGLQMHLILIGSDKLTNDRLNYLSNLFELPEKYSLIFKNHKFYIADNNKMSDKDLDFIDKIMDNIPDTLKPDLRLVTVINPTLSNYNYYYEQDQEQIKLEYGELGAVNVFRTLGSNTTNGFPPDIKAKYIDGFCSVFVHEVTHRLDHYIYPIQSLSERRSQLLKQAGFEKLQYLRSMFDSTFFQNAPQEFIASIANQWFCSSEHTFQLGIIRFDKGYHEPINQALFFCELYSLGKDFTRFYTIDTNGNIDLQPINLKRDNYGHINQLIINNITYNFNLDVNGNVLGYSIPNYLNVSTNNLSIAASVNSTKTLDITSNISWTAVSNQTWLTVSNVSGSGNATITLTATANPTPATRIAIVTVSGTGVTAQTITVIQDGGTTGIIDLTEKDYAIYPNPTSNILYFNSKVDKTLISIFDLNGKMVLRKQINDNQINISNFPNGVYTIKIIDKTGVLIKKFVKQ